MTAERLDSKLYRCEPSWTLLFLLQVLHPLLNFLNICSLKAKEMGGSNRQKRFQHRYAYELPLVNDLKCQQDILAVFAILAITIFKLKN